MFFLIFICLSNQYIELGNKEMVELLLKNGANLEKRDNENNTALIYSAKEGI